MSKYYEIQSAEIDDNPQWETWKGSSDLLLLLESFINAVNDEQIDDVNRFWKVEVK